MTVNEKIKAMREKSSITQAALGDMLGVSDKTVSKWECGESAVPCELLPAIADIFTVNIDELFSHSHDCGGDIKSAIYERLHTVPPENALDEISILVSYMIMGAQTRQDEDGGYYTEEVMDEIINERREWIETHHRRPQRYENDGGMIFNFSNDKSEFLIMENSNIEKRIKLFENFNVYQKAFTLLALPDAAMLLRFIFGKDMPDTYTADYLMEKSGASKQTVYAYINCSGADATIKKAIVKGSEIEIYRRCDDKYLYLAVNAVYFSMYEQFGGSR